MPDEEPKHHFTILVLNKHIHPSTTQPAPTSASPYILLEDTPPALRRARRLTPSLLMTRARGHVHRRTAMIARILITQRPRTNAPQTRRIVVPKRIRMRAPTIQMLVVRVALATASTRRLLDARVRRGIRGIRIGISAGRAGLMQAEFLLLVVSLVADARAPGLVRVESGGAALGVVCGLLVGAGGGAGVSVFEFADLRVDEAFDAGRGRAGVVGGGAARGAVFKGGDGVHGGGGEAVAGGVPSRVQVPAKVGEGREEEEDYQED